MKTPPSLRPALSLVGVAAILITAGCATGSYEMKVDSISRLAATKPASYRIENRNPAVEDHSLRYKEAAEYIKTALSGHGLWEAPTPAGAELVVELDYGIEAPRVIYQEADLPIYANVQDLAGSNVVIKPKDGGSIHADGNPVDPDDNQIVGFTGRLEAVTVYEKHLAVTCHENKPVTADQPVPELWRVSVSIKDPSKDLRENLPLLASAVLNKIGAATDGVTLENLKSNDPAIAFIKRGME